MNGTEQASTLRDYVQIARRRRWIILAVVALTTFSAAFFSLRQEKLYEASAEVLVRAGFGSSQSPDRVLQTQADIAAASSEVARRVRDQLRLDRDPPIEVSPKTESDILIFSSTASSPRLAAGVATAYARAFRDFQRELVTADIREELREVEAEIREVLAQANLDRTLYASLLDKREELRTLEALETSRAFLVRPATLGVQVQPKPVRNTILGFFLGLILGLGLALLLEALDTRVRSTAEVTKHLGVPLLGRVPRPLWRRGHSDQLVMINDPDGPGANAFRSLQANVDFARNETDARVLLVTSAGEGEGKSTTAANLAVALALDGQQVVLAEFDLHRPFIDRFFNLGGPGVAEVASGRAKLEAALESIPLGWPGTRQEGGTLEVLHAGDPESLDDVLSSRDLGAVLDDLRDRDEAGIVLVDSTPLVFADAVALTRFVDAVIIVMRLDIVHRQTLRELKRILDAIPAKAIGFVATGVKPGVGDLPYGGYYGRPKPRGKEPVA